jgi:transposase
MTQCNTKPVKLTIGIDVGDKWCHVAVLDRRGQLMREVKVATTAKAVAEMFGTFPRARVALEVGTHSPWLSRVLTASGHQVIVANARLVRAIALDHKKSDKVDARTLADLAFIKPERLYPIQHRGEEAQADLAIVRARHELVKTRTALINHVRGAVKSFGQRLPSSSSAAFETRVAKDIPESLGPALMPLLVSIRVLTEEIKKQTRLIQKLCQEKYRETERLTQVPGVGFQTGLAFVLTLEDPARFSKSRKVAAFVGLTPRQKESGDARPQLGITKCGDRMLRRLLVQCGHYILGHFGEDCDLRRHGEAIARRGGGNAKKRAAVAVARKLAVLLHRLWCSGAPYEPLRGASRKKMSPKMKVPIATT